MLIKNIVRYIIGYVFFEVKGINTQNFLNTCVNNNIQLTNVCFAENCITAGCSVKEYKKLQKIKIDNVRRKILKKVGIRFGLNRYRKRWGLFLGAALMIISLVILSQFVWGIDVSGNERVSTNLILQTLSECGFKEGTNKNKINITQIENKMLDKVYDLSWISINLDGSSAHVEVKERRPTPTVLDDKRPSNLIAASDGVIIKMEITKGKPIAQIGSGVVKGEMLVSGLYNDKKDNVILEHSSGKVTARVESNKTFKVSSHGSRKTGVEKKIFYSFTFFNNEVDLSFGNKPITSEWKLQKNTENIVVFGLNLPFKIIKHTFSRDKTEEYFLNDLEAKKLIKMEIEHFENENFYDAEIVSKKIVWSSQKDHFSAKVDYIVNMNIAVQQYIETD